MDACAYPASIDNLTYPGWDCALAESDAESATTMWHYRDVCQQTYGGDLPDSVNSAEVTECVTDEFGYTVVNVSVCCPAS